MTDCLTEDRPASEFQTREAARTTLQDLVRPDGSDDWADGMDGIPAQSRVPEFPDERLDAPSICARQEVSAPPTTRRETPLPASTHRRKRN